MELHTHRLGLVVMDGRRIVATARPKRSGWVLTMVAGCWATEDAREPNAVGIVDTKRVFRKTRREAAKLMGELAGPASSRSKGERG